MPLKTSESDNLGQLIEIKLVNARIYEAFKRQKKMRTLVNSSRLNSRIMSKNHRKTISAIKSDSNVELRD